MSYQWWTVLGYWQELLEAIGLTMSITVLAFALALVLALLAALARNSKAAILRFAGGVYVEVVRNTPILLQIFVVFFALPSLGMRFDAFTAGVIALGVNVGAYLAETFRAGINDVPVGQREAAEILALNRFQVFWIVVLPQALRKVYPTIVNNLILTMLGTSLLSALGLPELTGAGLVINARTLLWVQVFIILLVVYVALSVLISYLGSVVGKYAFKPALPRSQRRAGMLQTLTSSIRLRGVIR